MAVQDNHIEVEKTTHFRYSKLSMAYSGQGHHSLATHGAGLFLRS